jgi:hypothetical protein
MSDETQHDATQHDATNNPVTGGAETAERVGFCQDCGTPLTKETLRSVGPGVFCEPCLAARVGAPAPNVTGSPNLTPLSGTPHPVLAALLAVIPGVGAVYNGQYAKGIAHFVILIVLNAGHQVTGFFHLLAFIWWVYQIVDAYQTAKARLEGRPLPNPFGLNEIGERMGLGKSWDGPSSAYTATAGTAGASQTYPPGGTPYGAGSPAAGPVSAGPGWVGYVPPTNFAGTPPPVPPTGAQTGTAWGQAPYTQTYAPTYPTAGGGAYIPTVPPVPPVPIVPVVPARRFPVGALWLVGLGLVFLLAEFAPEWGWDWNLSGMWVLALVFAGLSAWAFVRRWRLGVRSVRAFRGAIILMTFALLFALQAADVAKLQRTWPVFLIVLGVLLIVERMALNTAGFAAAVAAPTSFVPPTMTEAEADAARTRAAWSATEPTAGPDDHDTTKGGY